MKKIVLIITLTFFGTAYACANEIKKVEARSLSEQDHTMVKPFENPTDFTRKESNKVESHKQAKGIRAFADPITGQLREPTAEEIHQINLNQNNARVQRQPLQVVSHADGRRSVKLDDRYMMNARVVVDENGHTQAHCTSNSSDHIHLPEQAKGENAAPKVLPNE